MTDRPHRGQQSDAYKRALHDAAVAATFASMGIELLRTQKTDCEECGVDRAMVVADLRVAVERLHENVRVLHQLTCGASNGRRFTIIK